MLAFADRFFDAVSRQDVEALDKLYRDDVKVWHNWDNVEQTKSENLQTLGSIPQRYDSFGYSEARTVEVEGGFLRQHVINASRDGKTALVPAILRVYVEDGRIHRIEEYFDRGQLTAALS
jgi:ketosteroid isomerase-like protein